MNIKDNCKIIEASLTKYNKHAEYHQIIIEKNFTNDNKITSEVNKTISSFYAINRFGPNGARVSTAVASTNHSELKQRSPPKIAPLLRKPLIRESSPLK
jgi:hypothetical protein